MLYSAGLPPMLAAFFVIRMQREISVGVWAQMLSGHGIGIGIRVP